MADLEREEGSQPDPLASQIKALEAFQAERANIIFSADGNPNRADVIERLDLLHAYQRDEARLTNFRFKHLASITLTESLQIFFDDKTVGFEKKLPLVSSNLEILLAMDSPDSSNWSEDSTFPEQAFALKEICGILEKEEIKDVRHKDQFQAYRQFFEFFIWRIGERNVLPELSERLVTTSLYRQLPDELKHFHTVTLPEVWLSLLEERENRGQIVSSAEWHRINREKTRRELVVGLTSHIDSEIKETNSELYRLRKEYAAVAETLGVEIIDGVDISGQTIPELNMPDLNKMLEYLYKEMMRRMADRDAVTLIMGISGDLDSSAQLALLSEVIKRYDLPYTIHAYYLKKDHHNSRFRRISHLTDHINSERQNPIVQLHVYEGSYVYELMLQSLVSESSEFLKPNGDLAKKAIRLIISTAQDAVNKMGAVGSDAERRSRKAAGIDKPIAEIEGLTELLISEPTMTQLAEFFAGIAKNGGDIKVTSTQILNFISVLIGDDRELSKSIEEAIDKREQSNLIHEMLVAIRGNLCRRFDYPLTVSAQQLSEVTTENFTTSDTFVSWFPLSKIPKTVLAHVFQEYILGSNGGVSLEQWEKFPMKYLVPYYPDFMQVKERNGQKIITRDTWFFPEFDYVEVEHDTSGIPEDVWDEIEQVERKSYIKIDGRIQWYLDPYLHYFLINGLSKYSVDELIQRYPARKTDIHLTAFLLAGAREKKQKDAYMLQTANF